MDSENTTAFLIGDQHFKAGKVKLCEEFISKIVALVKQKHPTFIVCLGDALDTNEIIRTQALKLLERFLDELTTIAPTYLLVGNHDYINHCQYLTSNHGFGAFKKWPNLTVVDKVIEESYGEHTFIFCPYVPKGMFLQALEEAKEAENIDWTRATAIFAHQEFRDCCMGAKISDDGDEWEDDYPPVFSGHIHDEQLVGENVFYPGSSLQHGYGDNGDKKVWNVTYTSNNGDNEPFLIEKYDVDLKWKKQFTMSVSEAREFNFELANKYDVRLVICDEKEAITVFKKSQFRLKLTRAGVKLAYRPFTSSGTNSRAEKLTKDDTSFEGVLNLLVKDSHAKIQHAYQLYLKTNSSN